MQHAAPEASGQREAAANDEGLDGGVARSHRDGGCQLHRIHARLDFTTEEVDKFQSRVESAKDLLTGPAHEAVLEAIAAKRLQISGG